jgi:hypothetical protein
MTTIRWVAIAALLVVVAGCGGGGESSTTIPSGKTVPKRMTRFMQRTKGNANVPGKLVITPVNEGWTLIGVVAAPETHEPTPSTASDELAKGCAERPTV